MTLPSSRGTDTKALHSRTFKYGGGWVCYWFWKRPKVGSCDQRNRSNWALADLHLTYRLNVPRMKYQYSSTDGKSSDSSSQKYKSKSKDVYWFIPERAGTRIVASIIPHFTTGKRHSAAQPGALTDPWSVCVNSSRGTDSGWYCWDREGIRAHLLLPTVNILTVHTKISQLMGRI